MFIQKLHRSHLPVFRQKKGKIMITNEDAANAAKTLESYRAAKAAFDRRILENEEWFRMRRSYNAERVSRSAWLFNSIINKHADFMDSIPECTVLPREQGDESAASALTKILPAVLERTDWESVYSDAAMYKLKAGTAAYSVLWNPSATAGRGDIDIRRVDLLNLFWEPGIRDIQNSRNIFCIELVDNDVLTELYPVLEGKTGGDAAHYSYTYDATVDVSGKSAVIDWYYKKRNGKKTLVHFCKFCCGEVLYASENDPECSEQGWYEHGLYPFVFDTLFREEGTPVGFGFIDIMKNAQEEIDLLGTEIMRNARLSARKRYFTRVEGAVNEEEFADFSRDFIHVQGSSIGEDSIREIENNPLSSVYVTVLNNKIDELKETSGNRDFSQGGTVRGVTSGTAISALQEAGNKLSRDMINASYRAFAKICSLCIELIRQFYDTPRVLRVLGEGGETEYLSFDNSAIRPRCGDEFGISFESLVPEFDISVKTHKKDSFSRAQENETALNFFRMGFFNPEKREEALACLEMMDIEGKEKLKMLLGN